MKKLIIITEFPRPQDLPTIGFIIFMCLLGYAYFGIYEPIKERGFKKGDIFMSLVALVFLAISISLLFKLNWF